MSFQTCWRCHARASDVQLLPIRQPSRVPIQTSPFTTSSSLSVNPPKKKVTQGGSGDMVRGSKQAFLKKKKIDKVPASRRPAMGERKALRKRVVLSNTNALEVQDLPDITAESITDETLEGQVLGIPGPVVDQLRAVEAFKPRQGWSLFRRPAMLMRKETLEYGKLIEEISHPESSRAVRRVLVGERGSGKTTLLLQAMTMAFMKNWVVINIPNAQDLTTAQTEYAPLPSTTPPLYIQKTYLASLLSTIAHANPILSTLPLLPSPPPKIPLPPNLTLSRLAHLGAADPTLAHPIFTYLLTQLHLPTRPPLLLTLDNLAHTMLPSAYRSYHFLPIHAHQLHIIRTFLSHLSGTHPLPNGGLILAATSQSNAPKVPALERCLARIEKGEEVGVDPFVKVDERVVGVFRGGGVEVQRVGGVGRGGVRGLMEYWAKSGVFPAVVDEGRVGEGWVVSAGLVGELERGCLRRGV